MQARFFALIFLATLVPAVSFAQYGGRGTSRYQSQINALGSSSVPNLPIPVFGVALSDLTKNFGDPRGDGTRSHEGLDIMARSGTPIASPTDAVVVRTGNGSGSGLYVRTANPGGEQFVYMHLSSIAPGIEAGDTVKRGEIIGFVGNTGNASGGAAHLHFEIRQNGAIDPYPRLTSVFTQAEREQSIREAEAKGITISDTSTQPPSTASVSPTAPAYKASLVFGETNNDIVTMQKFLIASPQGAASIKLKNTGATGYFGPLTRDALKEYQVSVGINPTGIVDEKTYTQIFAFQTEGDSSETEEEGTNESPATPTTPGTSQFTRDLEFGMTHEDVRTLQKFLNAHGAQIAASGVGSPGQETNYFGALTKAAVAKYQAANGITPAAGYFGPKTRAFVNTR